MLLPHLSSRKIDGCSILNQVFWGSLIYAYLYDIHIYIYIYTHINGKFRIRKWNYFRTIYGHMLGRYSLKCRPRPRAMVYVAPINRSLLPLKKRVLEPTCCRGSYMPSYGDDHGLPI